MNTLYLIQDNDYQVMITAYVLDLIKAYKSLHTNINCVFATVHS